MTCVGFDFANMGIPQSLASIMLALGNACEFTDGAATCQFLSKINIPWGK